MHAQAFTTKTLNVVVQIAPLSSEKVEKIKIPNLKKMTFLVNKIAIKLYFQVVMKILYPHPQKRLLEMKKCSVVVVLRYLFFRRTGGWDFCIEFLRLFH